MIFFIARFIFRRQTHRILWCLALLNTALSLTAILLVLLPRETIRDLRHVLGHKLKAHAEFMMRLHYITYQGLWRRGNGR